MRNTEKAIGNGLVGLHWHDSVGQGNSRHKVLHVMPSGNTDRSYRKKSALALSVGYDYISVALPDRKTTLGNCAEDLLGTLYLRGEKYDLLPLSCRRYANVSRYLILKIHDHALGLSADYTLFSLYVLAHFSVPIKVVGSDVRDSNILGGFSHGHKLKA